MNPPVYGDRGFSLMEVMVATVIAVIAVLGLAHTFGNGRALIHRYGAARAAQAEAQGRLEILSSLAQPGRNPSHQDLDWGPHHDVTPLRVDLGAGRVGFESWTIDSVDDPVNGSGTVDYKRATVHVTWSEGAVTDKVRLSRVLPAP